MIPCLTLIRPMAAAIVHGSKRIENRPRDLPKKMRGVPTIVGVHAGKGWDEDYEFTVRRIDGVPCGMGPGCRACGPCYQDRLRDEGIVGLMLLTGRVFTEAPIIGPGVTGDLYDPWWGGPFGYEIATAIAFKEPIPCRGMLGFWTPIFDRVPDEIVAGVETLQFHATAVA